MRYFIFILLLWNATACRPVVIKEKTVAFVGHQWMRNQPVVVQLYSTDSAAYECFFIVRHTEKFEFASLPVSIRISDTAHGSAPIASLNINAPLVQKNGQWSGSNMDDLYHHRIKIFPPIVLNKGVYKFIITHQMKENPLQHILDAGIAIEPHNSASHETAFKK